MPADAATDRSKSLFTFAHITDTHLSEALDVVSPTIEAINTDRHHAQPDFVVFGGDHVQGNRENGAETAAQMRLFKQCVDRLKAPSFTICHNHDTWGEHPRGAQYRAEFGDDALSYVQLLPGDFHAIFISGVFERDGQLVDIHDQVDWLDARLAEAANKRVLIFAHVPVLPARGPILPEAVEHLAKPKWHAGHYCYKDPHASNIREAIARHGNVVAYYCGHSHVHDVQQHAGTHYVVTSALVSQPWEYRYVEVFPDRITHRCIQPHANRDKANMWLNCVDAEHPAVQQYHDGNADERDFVIEL